MNWSDIFEYKDGSLYWLDRGRHSFRSASTYKAWKSRRLGKVAGTISSERRSRVRHVQIVFDRKRLYAHRIVWEMHNGKIPENMQIDHIDGDGTNNNIKNLRLVTAGGNRKNQPLRSDNKSGLFGVRWWDAKRRFEAYINSGGARVRLGLHKTLLDAACARKRAEIELGFHENHGRSKDIVASANRARELVQ